MCRGCVEVAVSPEHQSLNVSCVLLCVECVSVWSWSELQFALQDLKIAVANTPSVHPLFVLYCIVYCKSVNGCVEGCRGVRKGVWRGVEVCVEGCVEGCEGVCGGVWKGVEGCTVAFTGERLRSTVDKSPPAT